MGAHRKRHPGNQVLVAGGIPVVMIRQVAKEPDADLVLVRHADGLPGGGQRALNGRHQQRRQDRDNGDHHQ